MIELILVGVVVALAIVAFFKKKQTMARVTYVILLVVMVFVLIVMFMSDLAVVEYYSASPGIPAGNYIEIGDYLFPIEGFGEGTLLYVFAQEDQLYFHLSAIIILVEMVLVIVGLSFATLAASRRHLNYTVDGQKVEVTAYFTQHQLIVNGEVKKEVKKWFASGLIIDEVIGEGTFAAKFGIGFWGKSVKATYNGSPISPEHAHKNPKVSSLEEKLISLKALHEKGLISDEEYQSRRSRIIEKG